MPCRSCISCSTPLYYFIGAFGEAPALAPTRAAPEVWRLFRAEQAFGGEVSIPHSAWGHVDLAAAYDPHFLHVPLTARSMSPKKGVSARGFGFAAASAEAGIARFHSSRRIG